MPIPPLKIITKRAGYLPELRDVPAPIQLAEMQRLVGGYVEPAMHLDSNTAGIRLYTYCNEDGRSRLLPINFYRPSDGAAIVGDVFLQASRWERGRGMLEDETLTPADAAIGMWLLTWLHARAIETTAGWSVVVREAAQAARAGTAPPNAGHAATAYRLDELRNGLLTDRDRQLAARIEVDHVMSVTASWGAM